MADNDVEVFRAEARRWLAANLIRRHPDEKARTRGQVHRTVEDIAEQRALQRAVHEAGFAGITWPVAYGGRSLSPAHQQAFDDEAVGYLTADLGIAGVVTRVVCANVMLAHASDAFNRRHLPRILAADELWVEFFSEPSAGSDLAGVTTTAVRDGDNWILNGEKVWSSGAYYADYGMCLARTDWDVPKHRGLTWFAVRTDAPGVTVEPLTEITGDAEFCRERFVDVVIADDERIGDVNDGWSVAQTALLWEREASSGSLSTTTRSGPMPFAPDLVALARRVGRADDPHVRQLVASAHVQDWALVQLGVRVGELMRVGGPAAAAVVAYVKLGAGIREPMRATAAMQIGGGAAVAWKPGDDDAVATALGFLNARVTAIAGGTNEMQRNGIGERVLGLPREPVTDRDKAFGDVLRDAARWGKP